MTDFPARQADPGARMTTRDDEAGDVELTADADGIVRPQTLAEHRAAEMTFRLPLAAGEQPYAGPLYVVAASPDEANPDEMTREQLRARASELGLPTSGTKAELADRIAAAATGDAGQPEVTSHE